MSSDLSRFSPVTTKNWSRSNWSVDLQGLKDSGKGNGLGPWEKKGNLKEKDQNKEH